MRDDAALDYELRDKGLTKIEFNPATLESVRAELDQMKAQEWLPAHLLRHDAQGRRLQRQDSAC